MNYVIDSLAKNNCTIAYLSTVVVTEVYLTPTAWPRVSHLSCINDTDFFRLNFRL